MRPLALIALLALVPARSGLTRAASLENAWEVKLGPAVRLQVAVCPDGTTVVSDGEGRLVGLDTTGRVAFDQRFAELGLVWSLACDDERILAAAGDAFQVHVFTRRPIGAPAFKMSQQVPMPGSRIAAAADGGYWILTHGGGPSRVHKISKAGEVEYSSPLGDLGLNPHFASVAPLAAQKALLVVARSQYAIQKIDRTGKVLDTLPSPSRDFTIRPFGERSDEVLNIVPLPNGRFAAHISKAKYLRPGVFQNYQVLEVLSSDLQLEHTGIPITRGALQGADTQGNLYFASVGKDGGVFVVKARLIE
jgi:hypothetical protein